MAPYGGRYADERPGWAGASRLARGKQPRQLWVGAGQALPCVAAAAAECAAAHGRLLRPPQVVGF